jgi:hypothetical protein
MNKFQILLLHKKYDNKTAFGLMPHKNLFRNKNQKLSQMFVEGLFSVW